jgi:hypothetical protein
VAPGHHLFSNPYREANHWLGASIFIRSKRWQPADTDAYQLNALFLNKQMEGFVSEVFSHVGGEIYLVGLNNATFTPPFLCLFSPIF